MNWCDYNQKVWKLQQENDTTISVWFLILIVYWHISLITIAIYEYEVLARRCSFNEESI